jgi:hypothetical protein
MILQPVQNNCAAILQQLQNDRKAIELRRACAAILQRLQNVCVAISQ